MKVYVVCFTWGEYSGRYKAIEKVFLTENKANEFIDKDVFNKKNTNQYNSELDESLPDESLEKKLNRYSISESELIE